MALMVGVLAVVGYVSLTALAQALAQCSSPACRNSLKGINSAASLWAEQRHSTQMPADFLSFTNQLGELGGPRILLCPADKVHSEAASWSDLAGSNISYVIPEPQVPVGGTNVFVRCPYHHLAIMADGNVIRERPGTQERKP